MNKALKPEDIIADGIDFTIKNGVKARKGSVAAIVANIKVLEDVTTLEDEKAKAWKILMELSETWFALELDQHLRIKNYEVQQLFDNLKKDT